jgi:hypothetical protein
MPHLIPPPWLSVKHLGRQVRFDEAVAELEKNPRHFRFSRCKTICECFFGEPRISGSHHIFKMKWAGDPRINIQDRGSFVSEYQVKQVIAALKKLQEDAKYEAECRAEACRRTTEAKRNADDRAREESIAKPKTVNAIEALTKCQAAQSSGKVGGT